MFLMYISKRKNVYIFPLKRGLLRYCLRVPLRGMSDVLRVETFCD